MRQIIGVVGPMASGKSEVAKILVEKYDFHRYSLSDRILEECKRMKIKNPDRKTMQNTGDDLRDFYENDVLAVQTLKLVLADKKELVVVESIRHPEEVELLKQFEARIIAVDATPENRFRYMRLRNRPGDPTTYEEFLKLDEREFTYRSENAIYIPGCMQTAEVTIYNNGSLHDLKMKTCGIISGLGIEGVHASKERLF